MRLFEDEDTLARLKEVFKPKEVEKKVALPEIQPGFKASCLSVGERTSFPFVLQDSWNRMMER